MLKVCVLAYGNVASEEVQIDMQIQKSKSLFVTPKPCTHSDSGDVHLNCVTLSLQLPIHTNKNSLCITKKHEKRGD